MAITLPTIPTVKRQAIARSIDRKRRKVFVSLYPVPDHIADADVRAHMARVYGANLEVLEVIPDPSEAEFPAIIERCKPYYDVQL